MSEIPTPWGEHLLVRAGLQGVFQPEVLSGTAGCTKPHDEIFAYLLARVEVDPRREAVYFVDDKLENLAAGAKFGLRGIWYRREESASDFQPAHTITALDELPRLPGLQLVGHT